MEGRAYHIPGGLEVRRVLPEKAMSRIVGGPGREYRVGEKNYPPDSKKDPEAGSWRLEIQAPKGGKQRFLHVLWTRKSNSKKSGSTPDMRWNPQSRQLRIEHKALLDFSKRSVRLLHR